jgi:hypothetical protein
MPCRTKTDTLSHLLDQAEDVTDPLVRDWLSRLRRGEGASNTPKRQQSPPDIHGEKATQIVSENPANLKGK